MTRVAWKQLGEIIPAVLTGWEKQKEAPIQKVRQLWKTAVGPPVALRTVPLALQKGLLLVSVDSPVWAAELTQLQTDGILLTLNEALGSELITELRFITRLTPR